MIHIKVFHNFDIINQMTILAFIRIYLDNNLSDFVIDIIIRHFIYNYLVVIKY